MDAKREKHDLTADLRKAIAESGLSWLALAKRAELSYSIVHGFASGGRSLKIESAARLADVLGLQLKPIRRGKQKG